MQVGYDGTSSRETMTIDMMVLRFLLPSSSSQDAGASFFRNLSQNYTLQRQDDYPGNNFSFIPERQQGITEGERNFVEEFLIHN